jgi:hypothetical protein
MLAHVPNVKANLISRGTELHIRGEDQLMSDLPEYRDERGDRISSQVAGVNGSKMPLDFDALIAGLGGVYATCPETNVLHLPDDPDGIRFEACIHEFAHDIMDAAFDADMRSQIERQFNSSKSKGLWKGAYAATNPKEFWAEISVWYFGGQGRIFMMPPPVPDPGPEALLAYDQGAYALADSFYSGKKQPHIIHIHEARMVHTVDRVPTLNPNPAELLFINNTAGRRRIYWVDDDGALHDFGVLEPYSRHLYQCYVGEYWLVDNQLAKTRTIFHVEDVESQVTIHDRSSR